MYKIPTDAWVVVANGTHARLFQNVGTHATFAKQWVHRRNAAAWKQEFGHLFLMADPKTLGDIRPQPRFETSQRIIGEPEKTLAHASLEENRRC